MRPMGGVTTPRRPPITRWLDCMSGPVPLTLACWDYDRTSALADGDVRPDGVDLTPT